MSLRKPLHQLSESDIESSSEGKRWLDLVRSYTLDIRDMSVTWDVASVAANTTVEQTVTATGLKVGDIILAVIKPTLSAGLGVLQGRVSAADTLSVQLINTTAAPIDPAPESYTVVYIKNTGK